MTNATYFRGEWSEPFSDHLTSDSKFSTGQSDITTPMMFSVGPSRYGEVNDIQILERSYVGNDLSFVALLPRPGADSLARLEQALFEGMLPKWLEGLRVTECEVYLPRFKTDCDLSLKTPLEALGMNLAFSADADFAGIYDRQPLFLNNVLHAATISVDEQGTEAAAATAIMGGFGAMSHRQPVVFSADHPFIYMIRHVPTGTILFLGVLFDPR
jgi:serpin B